MSPLVKEKRKKRQKIYQGKILDLYVDQVTIPDGSTHIREVVGHQEAVAVVAVLDDGQLLLIQQYRYAVDTVCLELPAGLIEKTETPLKAARRECIEETGYNPQNLKSLGWIYSSPGFSQEKIHLFLATGLKPVGSLCLDQDEFLIVKKADYQHVLDLIAKKKIKDGKTVLGLLLAKPYIHVNG